MSWLRCIEACNRHALGTLVPLFARGQRVGYLRRDRAERLTRGDLPALAIDHACHVRGVDSATLGASFACIARTLAQEGAIRSLTGEHYAVATVVRGETLALLDRAAAPYFGIASAGVHVNGWVRGPSGLEMWVARRARGKATFPGLLDNLVAGGQPHGIGLFANVVKECGEEAGIPWELARTARPVGVVSYVHELESGLRPDTVWCFDLELSADFEPRCVDGEVESFERLPIDEVAAIVRDTDRFKFNCKLVILDFLVRHGLIDADDPEYPAIVAGLRRTLPA